MDFWTIKGIPPLPPVVSPRSSTDVTRVFAAEFSRRQDGESAPREESRRGLESEEDLEELGLEPESVPGTGLHIVI